MRNKKLRVIFIKQLFFIFTVLFLCAPVFAQITAGQKMIDFRTSLGFQLNNSGIAYSSDGSKTDWGTLGVDFGFTYYHFLTEKFGLGAEFSYGDFGGANITFSSVNTIDDGIRLYNLLLAARYNMGYKKHLRVYFPFGAGFSAVEQSLDINYYGTIFQNKDTQLSPLLYIGAGFEFDIGRNGWSLGIETRYNTFWYDTDKLIKFAPAVVKSDGVRRYEYISLQLHISKRF